MVRELSVGVDLGGTNITMALVSRRGEIILKEKFLTRVKDGPRKVVERIAENYQKLSALAGKDKVIKGIGLGVAGQIDHQPGVVLFAPNLFWKNFPLVQKIKAVCALEVVKIENDANAAALAESLYGAGKGVKNQVCITLGTGVGGGIIINGKIYQGFSGSAGEIGHLTIDPEGPRCPCGNYGCLERFVGAGYIVRRAREMGIQDKGLSPQVLAEKARAGNRLALKVWDQTGRYLGIGLAGLVNLLNPEMIVLTGGVARAGQLVIGPAVREIKRRALSASLGVKVVSAELGDTAGVIGAAALVWSKK